MIWDSDLAHLSLSTGPTPSSSPRRGLRSAGRSRARCASVRPDDLAAGVIEAALAQAAGARPGHARRPLPRLRRTARRARRQPGPPGRRPARTGHLPAATVNRFCASSVQTARMASHAIWAGEGDAYVSAGVECVSRYRGFGSRRRRPSDTQNPLFAAAERAPCVPPRPTSPGTTRGPTASCPTSTSRWARRRRTWRPLHGISRADQDDFGVRSQNRCREGDRRRGVRGRDRSGHPARRHAW